MWFYSIDGTRKRSDGKVRSNLRGDVYEIFAVT